MQLCFVWFLFCFWSRKGEHYYFARQRGTQWAPTLKIYMSPLGKDSEKLYSNGSKRAWSACWHSSEGMVMRWVEVSTINLQVPAGLGSTCLRAAYHNSLLASPSWRGFSICECPGVSGRGVGCQWPAAGPGTLRAAVRAGDLWRRSPLSSLPPPQFGLRSNLVWF